MIDAHPHMRGNTADKLLRCPHRPPAAVFLCPELRRWVLAIDLDSRASFSALNGIQPEIDLMEGGK